MTQSPQWGRLPYELQGRAQWLLARPDAKGDLKVPTTILADGTLVNGSSTDRSTWLSFDHAMGAALHHKLGIGYCIAPDDPFVCVDLDVKGAHNEPDQSKWSTADQLNRFWLIAQTFDTYVELSQSGKGLHVWCYGQAMDGARHDNVEVYAQSRFMVCTGNVLIDKPIAERQEWINVLVAEIRAKQGAASKVKELDEKEEVYTDDQILERARTADNSAKYIELFEGRWEQYDFPSQSEADLALLSMFTFYSRSNEQCRRLFRMSTLGKRSKAQKDDKYLDFSLKLIRGRQEREDKQDAAMAAQGAIIAGNVMRSASEKAAISAYAASLGPASAASVGTAPSPGSADASVAGAANAAAVALLPAAPAAVGSEKSLEWPPGFAGALAGFIYRSAPRPVKEVAIVAALGWLAGVCGKQWNIPNSGLNVYIILVARSAVGKEAMHSGLGALTNALVNVMPSAGNFVDFSDFASGPALVKACSEKSCFVNVAGEWGRKLKKIAQDDGRDGPMQSLRTAMTNLYQKSSSMSIVGGISYSKKETNIASVSGVAYSMIGETTPGTLYDSLTESMMEDGFLSRFTIVEYTGDRPPANDHTQYVPEPELVQHCMGIVMASAGGEMRKERPNGVYRDDEAAAIMKAFDLECDTEINKSNDEAWRQMWNRAQLKMMRIAALLAVGDNCAQPCINATHTRWALDLIRRDIAIMRRRIESGDIGTGDGVRERKLISLIKEYLSKPTAISYHVPVGMREAGIVPRAYLQIRTSRLAAFSTHRLGATKALDESIRSLCDSGYIMEIDKAKAFDAYGSNGRAFRILSLPDYSEHK